VRVPPESAGLSLPGEVRGLVSLMMAARCLGFVVVAAAGNNSDKKALPERANLPALMGQVIGVAAVNRQNGRSCFSNAGDFAAPGGDGGKGCKPQTGACMAGDPTCGFAVVGPTYESGQINYVFWAGSSFSTPMATGLAALTLEAGAGKFTPGDVEALLACGATRTGDSHLGAGVINVRRTLGECLARRQAEGHKPAVDDLTAGAGQTAG
jgi:subtilisin family serine protease